MRGTRTHDSYLHLRWPCDIPNWWALLCVTSTKRTHIIT